MLKKTLILLTYCLLIFYSLQASAIDLERSPQVRAYLQEVSQKYHYDIRVLWTWFNQVTFNKKIMAKFKQPPPTPTKVQQPPPLRKMKVFSPEIVQQGVKFWNENAKALAKAEKKYGVPAKVIVSIFGIETTYGRDIGHYTAINSLATFAFFSSYKRDYFKSELTQFLLLVREENWDPFAIESSFDGGLGMPQFMPSSYREYAVSAKGKKKSNLFNNPHDAIASIGNYLAQESPWTKGVPIAVPGKITNQNYKELLNEKGKLHFTLAQLKTDGIEPIKKTPTDLPVGVVFFATPHGVMPWITFPNYMTIRSYNGNPAYEIGVAQLSDRIATARKRGY